MILCDDIHVHAQDNDVFVEILMIIHHDHDINYCIRFGGGKNSGVDCEYGKFNLLSRMGNPLQEFLKTIFPISP